MSTDQTGSWTLPDEYVMLGDTLRRFMEREVCPVEEKQPPDVFATEAVGRVVDRCMQIFGAMGMTHGLPLERCYRERRIRRVGEGPSEVQRMVIARDLLSGRKKGH